MNQAFAPCIPETAPFTPEPRAWLNGYLAGLFSRQPVAESESPRPLTILWGSQTGTAEKLARQAAKTAGGRRFTPHVLDMAEATPAALVDAGTLLVITSTYGDGEPPDNARALLAALREEKEPQRLAGIRYSLCALGDSSYRLFCQCGRDFDAYLSRLGATAIAPRAECDVEYETTFA